MSKWQPIETAPKDGTRVLLACRRSYGTVIVCGEWDDDKYAKKPRPHWNTDHRHIWGMIEARRNPPTHWMPFPAPPEAP